MEFSTVLKLAVATTAAALSLISIQAKPAQASSFAGRFGIAVNFTNQGTLTTTEYSQKGLTVTGSDILSLDDKGLGVGKDDGRVLFGSLIENGASVSFSFSSAAEDVSLKAESIFTWSTIAGSTPGFNIEGFNVSGTSLGAVSVPFDSFLSSQALSISSLFDNSLLSAFKFFSVGTASGGSGARITSVYFNPASNPAPVPTSVPEPSTIPALAILALGGFLLKRYPNNDRK